MQLRSEDGMVYHGVVSDGMNQELGIQDWR